MQIYEALAVDNCYIYLVRPNLKSQIATSSFNIDLCKELMRKQKNMLLNI